MVSDYQIMENLFSIEDLRKTYEHIGDHIKTKDVILKYSQNQLDIRDVALDRLDLSSIQNVLDLGCGYGFFITKLKGRLHKKAKITGIDIIEKNNKKLFLQSIQTMGYAGKFIQGPADQIKKMPDTSYDLIIASYSLYFFPHLIGEISRILKPKGIFITITHSKSSLQEAIEIITRSISEKGLNPSNELAISKLFRNFSLEDGQNQLTPYFDHVERILYDNVLRFNQDEVLDCIQYLDKKGSLLFKEVFENYPDQSNEIMEQFYHLIHTQAESKGQFMLTKHDAVFRCHR